MNILPLGKNRETAKPERSKLRKFLSRGGPVKGLTLSALSAVALLSGCSVREDQQYVQPFTEDVSNWRQYLGVAVAVQFLLLAWVFWHTGRRGKMSRLFLALLLVPLVWTKLGEWIYRLGRFVLDWGIPGKLVAIVLSFMGGIHGTSNVYSYLLGGVVFNDTEFLLYWAVPGVAVSFVVAISYLTRRKCK